MATIDTVSYYKMTELEKDIVMGKTELARKRNLENKPVHRINHPSSGGTFIFLWVKCTKTDYSAKRYMTSHPMNVKLIKANRTHTPPVYGICKSDKDIYMRILRTYVPDYIYVYNTTWGNISYMYDMNSYLYGQGCLKNKEDFMRKASESIFDNNIKYYDEREIMNAIPMITVEDLKSFNWK